MRSRRVDRWIGHVVIDVATMQGTITAVLAIGSAETRFIAVAVGRYTTA